MALTRKFLSAMGIEEEKIEQIITAHTEVTNALKEERDEYKGKAEKLPEIQKELKELKETTSANNQDAYKVKYEAIKEEYEEYKKGITEKETKANKEQALRKLLKEIGISDKRLDSVVKVTSLDEIDLNKDGDIKEKEKLAESLKEEWSDFIAVQETKGAKTSTPPANTGGGGKTRKEINAIKDPEERRKAIAENPSLYPQLQQ